MEENNIFEDAPESSNTFFGVQIPKIDLSKLEMPKVEFPKFELPKVEMPKVEMPKFELPKVEFPKVDVTAFNEVASTVKTAASDSMLAATQAANKVRNSAAHTVTLVREAVGV
ncbi:MAG: hypothetical protein WBJ33_03530 [Candidatus Nanopelagicales bacterium]|jgi:hypothetical protein